MPILGTWASPVWDLGLESQPDASLVPEPGLPVGSPRPPMWCATPTFQNETERQGGFSFHKVTEEMGDFPLGMRSPHTQGGDLCLGKPHLGAPRRSAGSVGLEWSQQDLPPNLHMLHALREVVGPWTPTCMPAQGRPCLSNGAIGQPPQVAPG